MIQIIKNCDYCHYNKIIHDIITVPSCDNIPEFNYKTFICFGCYEEARLYRLDIEFGENKLKNQE